MNKRLYVDFHILQTVPPSCINRDDTGSPKTAVYGGVTRARVSSQAWKHAMRAAFAENARLDVGKRTKKAAELVKEQILVLDPEQKKADKMAKEALKYVGIKSDDKKGTDALIFISSAQAKALAELVVGGCTKDEEYEEALIENPSADMVLFGRMVAQKASLKYDAAAQVAHSISTHAVQNEYDYFTAVDDCQVEDNAGAGHLGTVEYNSSTLYRYATVNVMELAGRLGAAQAAETVRAFGEAFLFSMPTGKQNTFANRTLPDAIYVTLREDQPVNLCGAFERAVPRSAQGYAAPSKAALVQYAQQMYSSFAEAPAQSFTVGSGLEELAPAQTAKAMLDALEKAVRDALAGNEVG
jgi:CRISPR system Cascade subunit CasC